MNGSPMILTLEGLDAQSRLPSSPYVIRGLRLVTGAGATHTAGALVIDGERLAEVGDEKTVLAKCPGLPVIDGRGFTAMPGLVNAHTHAAMGFFRGLGHGKVDMIETFMFPAEKSLTDELLEPLAYSYLVDGLKSGVTCFGDHYYFISGIAKAADRLGVRAVVGETVADLGGALPGRAGWDRFRAELDRWNYSSRITPAIAPHAADTVSEPLLKELSAFAKAHDLPLHMHLAQTDGERRRVEARAGATPVAVAARNGALGPKTLAVHLVAIDDQDVALLKDSGATAGICPASQIIYERLAPIAKLLTAGVPVALGTDCAGSNDAADLMAEMKLYALLTKDRGAPAAATTPAAALKAASLAGADVFGLGGSIGSLAKGKRADVVFLRDDIGSDPGPLPDANLIYSLRSRHVRHVMIDGRLVLAAGQLTQLNEGEITRAYQDAVGEINRRLGKT